MSREIKFRAYSVDGEDSRMDFFDLTEKGLNVPWIAKNCEIMQYTGLQDKNGVEIYDGDIVFASRYSDSAKPVAVIYEQKAGRFSAHGAVSESSIKQYGLEVIGNVYENPELMTPAVAAEGKEDRS